MQRILERMQFSGPVVGATCLVALIVTFGIYVSMRPTSDLPDSTTGSPAIARNRTVEVGGVLRPASDIGSEAWRRRRSANEAMSEVRPTEQEGPHGYGSTPKLARSTSPAIEAVYDAIVAGPDTSSPESFSPMLPARPFDRAEYHADPEAYLSAVAPGRVWQAAQPAEGVPVLKRISPRKFTMRQGESVRLQVKTASEAPVTFTSFDLGAFENQLTSITVPADADGIAEATFTGTSGTIAKVSILAASPMASSRVQFQMNVLPAPGGSNAAR